MQEHHDRAIITNVARLRAWAANSNRRPVQLALSELSPEQNTRWERRLNRWRRDCGCSVASMALLSGGAAYFACLYTSAFSTLLDFLSVAATGLVMILGATLLGKVVGQRVAQGRLRACVRALAAVAQAQ